MRAGWCVLLLVVGVPFSAAGQVPCTCAPMDAAGDPMAGVAGDNASRSPAGDGAVGVAPGNGSRGQDAIPHPTAASAPVEDGPISVEGVAGDALAFLADRVGFVGKTMTFPLEADEAPSGQARDLLGIDAPPEPEIPDAPPAETVPAAAQATVREAEDPVRPVRRLDSHQGDPPPPTGGEPAKTATTTPVPPGEDPPSASPVGRAVWLSAGVLAAGASIWMTHRIAPWLGALFSRITRDGALRQPARTRLLELLEAHPGMTTSELMSCTGLGEGTVRYHMRVLRRHGLVEARTLARSILFFPARCGDPARHAVLAILRCRMNRRIAATVGRAPGIHQGEIARRIGLSQSQAHARAEKMVALRLLQKTREGKRVRYHPTPAMDQALAELARLQIPSPTAC